MDEQPKPTIKIPGLLNQFDVVTSLPDPIHNMDTQLRVFLEMIIPHLRKNYPQVRIDFKIFRHWISHFPPVYITIQGRG